MAPRLTSFLHATAENHNRIIQIIQYTANTQRNYKLVLQDEEKNCLTVCSVAKNFDDTEKNIIESMSATMLVLLTPKPQN